MTFYGRMRCRRLACMYVMLVLIIGNFMLHGMYLYSPSLKRTRHPDVHVMNLNNVPHPALSFTCVRLGTLSPSVEICIHPVRYDKWVSATLARGELWEQDNVDVFLGLLDDDPELHVIDIGANLGQYTLLAAHRGRSVLSIEARLLHVRMMQDSVTRNGFQDRVTLLHNAISDSYGRVQLAAYYNNQGGSHIVDQPRKRSRLIIKNNSNIQHDMRADSILMRDLADVTPFSKALMKIDIEGFEHRAFRYPHRLFSTVFIPVVMMEWNAMLKLSVEEIEPLLTFFQSQGYQAYGRQKGKRKTIKLDYGDWKHWSYDVIFKHNSYHTVALEDAI